MGSELEYRYSMEKGKPSVTAIGNYAFGYVWWIEQQLKKMDEIESTLLAVLGCDGQQN